MNINLEQYGWEDFFAFAKKSSKNQHLEHGRIISVHKSRYEVVTCGGIFSCEILGNIQFRKDPLKQPAVGDWILLKKEKDTFVIHEVLERKSLIKRQKKHDNFPKPIAANVDCALIVQSVGPDFNIKRIERILIHIYDAQVEPVIVINKIDLSEDGLVQVKKSLESLNADIKIFFTSYKTGEGVSELEKALEPGKTIIFIGSSGVGKSSLINSMLGTPLQETQEISSSTGKGRHTTTSRRLIKLNSGILVIDTPGTREFGMHDDNFSLQESFEGIEKIAGECRFSNCSHQTEPECAILKALEEGKIEKEHYERYLFLQNELHQSAKQMRQNSKQSSRNRVQPLRSLRLGKTKKKK